MFFTSYANFPQCLGQQSFHGVVGSYNETTTEKFTKEYCDRNGTLKLRKTESAIDQSLRSKFQQNDRNNLDEYKKTKKSNTGRETTYRGSKKSTSMMMPSQSQIFQQGD